MKTNIELLAPGGDIDSIKAAIIAGADAIYCGLDRFNARNRAHNIDFDDLYGILRLAHKNSCKIFITLNIIIVETEIAAVVKLLTKLANTSIDGIIIQDFGVFYLLSKYFRNLSIHASTQLTTHNEGQIAFLSKLSAKRINLSRELNMDEITALTDFAHGQDIETEAFVHGSYCVSFSGICYMSSFQSGNSGNRGRCSQPCREKYQTTKMGNNYPLNLKDNSAFFNLKELAAANVDSLKVEGRMKGFDYVYTVVDVWRKQLDRLRMGNELSKDDSELHMVFNRDFSNSFLTGEIGKDMFIDNPRVDSINYLIKKNKYSSVQDLEYAKSNFYDQKDNFKKQLAEKIAEVSISKIPLKVVLSGRVGEKLMVEVKNATYDFVVYSESNLVQNGKYIVDKKSVFDKLKSINDSEYYIEEVNLEHLMNDVSIPFKDLTLIKNEILKELNVSNDFKIKSVPAIVNNCVSVPNPKLAVLINSEDDIYLANKSNANIIFQLPSVFENNYQEIFQLFENNRNLIPWFPSILIGDNYRIACEFLNLLKPEEIITNNTGIAYEAYRMGVKWIAGPYLNIANSYSLLLLKEEFNCSGAFVSNEISRRQIKGIKQPQNFELYCSIYHPILLMTSRQCLFQQVIGCHKTKIDNTCITNCSNSVKITNSKHENLIVEKSKGNYHRVFNGINCLNLDVVEDIQDTFSGYFIDLRDVKTETILNIDKLGIVNVFQGFIENKSSRKEIEQIIYPTTNKQYEKGI